MAHPFLAFVSQKSGTDKVVGPTKAKASPLIASLLLLCSSRNTGWQWSGEDGGNELVINYTANTTHKSIL